VCSSDLDSVSDTRLLSAPVISAVNGSVAIINVGGEEPILSGEEVTSGGNSISNIDRRETGITVTAQPIINEGGNIRIKLIIDIADLGPERLDRGPAFTTRVLETEVLTRHGQTFLLGGIIIDNTTNSNSKIPGLGGLPLLGPLFGTKNDTVERTELLIAVTTTIADSSAETDAFLTDFMRSTHAVRDMLGRREEDLSQGFLFNRISYDNTDEAAPFFSDTIETLPAPASPAPTVVPAPVASPEPEAEASPKDSLPPIIRGMLQGMEFKPNTDTDTDTDADAGTENDDR